MLTVKGNPRESFIRKHISSCTGEALLEKLLQKGLVLPPSIVVEKKNVSPKIFDYDRGKYFLCTLDRAYAHLCAYRSILEIQISSEPGRGVTFRLGIGDSSYRKPHQGLEAIFNQTKSLQRRIDFCDPWQIGSSLLQFEKFDPSVSGNCTYSGKCFGEHVGRVRLFS